MGVSQYPKTGNKNFGCFLVLRKPLFVRFCFVVWVLFATLPTRHLVIAPICKTKKKLFTVYESFLFQSQKKRSGVAFTNEQHKKRNKMIPCIPYLHICNGKRFKPPKSLREENDSTSLLKQHANIISLNKARLHGLSLHCCKRWHLAETLRSHMHRPEFSRRYPIIMEI